MKTLTALHRPHHRQQPLTRTLVSTGVERRVSDERRLFTVAGGDNDYRGGEDNSEDGGGGDEGDRTGDDRDERDGGDNYGGGRDCDSRDKDGASNGSDHVSPATGYEHLPPIRPHGVARSNDRDRWSNKSDEATSHHHHHHSHQQQASGHQPVYTNADDSHGNSGKKRLNSVDSTNQSETSNTRDKADGGHVRHHHSSGDTTNSRHQHSLATLRHLPLDSDNTVNSQGKVDGTTGPHKVLWHSKPPRLSLTMQVTSDADNRKPIKAEFSPGQGHAGTMWPPTTSQINADGGGVSSSFIKSRNNKSWCAAEQGARTGRSQTMENAYRAAVRRNTSLVRDTSLRREGGATSGGHAQQTANQASKQRALQNNNNNTGAGKAPVAAASNPTLRRVLSFNNISSPSPQLYHTDATQAGASSRKVQVSHQQRPTAAVRPLHMRSTARESSVPRYSHTPAPAINDTTNLNIADDQSTYNSDRDEWGNDEVDIYADEAMTERHERILDWLVGVANEGGAERPATPPLIADMPPPQTDTAIHIVYDGD